ncbi:ATP-binding protein [Mucilaginibacter roseus]|uniref:histidine kinase n=1 Tax=Mucilaginibacter roseus TaxID=1528868 RepID=A0ABS8U7Q2_9SPHI|nr:ATP-binding protein [Mucilaginibacter roseus]MCD8742437.1 ATP-binding protein [Mucilaginibacter roseus]
MSYRFKIRLLLALLTVSLFITAVILPNSYTPGRTLEQTARILEDNIHEKESFIEDILHDSVKFNELKQLRKNDQLSLKLIKDYTVKNHVWFITLDSSRLSFWSGVKVLPANPGRIKPGRSFIKQPNGYYEAVRKDDGAFSAIFLFPIKINYAFQNNYLRNGFTKDLLTDDDDIVDLADFTDRQFYPVHSISGQYLFGVKLKDNAVNSRYFYSELTVWFFAFLVLCLLVNDFCLQLARKGRALLAIVLLTCFISALRFINLYYCWPDFTFKLDLFNPAHYASSSLFPSLGDFCINILFTTWLAAFIYVNRNYLLNNVRSRAGSYAVLLGCSAFIVGISAWLLVLFRGLVINSNINFDVTNVLNLTGLSVVGLGVLCFAFLIFYLINDAFAAICIKLPISNAHKAFVFLMVIVAATAIYAWVNNFNAFFLLMGVMVFIRAYDYRFADGRLSAVPLLIMVFVGAIISSLELNTFQSIKEIGQRKLLIKKLLVPDDANVNESLSKLEKRILKDAQIVQAFGQPGQAAALKTRLQKLYFDGTLSRYELSIHQFDNNEKPLATDTNYSLSVFKDLVMYSSFKVSRYFYRENESFGSQNYFAVMPVSNGGVRKGCIVIELRSKKLNNPRAFPELLVEGVKSESDDFKNYSYAFYTDARLVAQSGNYVYDVVNKTFDTPVNTYRFVTTNSIYPEWYRTFSRHNHLVFKQSKRNVIVVSRSENALFFGVTALTFFFVLLLLFSLLVVLIRWLWLRIRILYISDNRIKWGFRINFDKILYKTRIQFSMILAVVFTLIIVGFITFLFISTQYNSQQEEMIRGKIARITEAFEEGQFNKYIDNINKEKLSDFDELANTYSADLTLFNLQGIPLISTQPKIYEYGLHVRRMNARAFIYMSRFQKSEYVNDEQIGDLNYKSVYAPLKNNKQQTVAYLQLPYFSNEVDYKTQVGALLNAMINVYALVFIAIGLLAVIIARQITAPLNFIQTSLSRIIYGKKNEPIKWDRDDEIGALVKEYNKMIAALENSAQKLAQSERESAWREMAKQVAHEIKNPLTPLKLGLQLLDKSWKDKDPKFDQKFERFSKSFVEQIESLSSIASEFSAFAKMPDTKMVKLNLFEVLNQAVIIFKQMDNLTINYQPPEEPFMINADRDQLLRCFNNLLKNAIEATPPDRNGVIDLNYLITSKNILLSIKDNGNGIPENMREKIFEPNFTTKSSGTGLGLAFIKNSIENAGGKVWFETELNVGTTFYFSLPAADANE